MAQISRALRLRQSGDFLVKKHHWCFSVFNPYSIYSSRKGKKRMEEEERKNSKKKYERERENSSFFSLTLLFELLLPFFRENIINLI